MQKEKPAREPKTCYFLTTTSLQRLCKHYLLKTALLFATITLLLSGCVQEREPAAPEEGEKVIEEQPGVKILGYRIMEGEFFRGDNIHIEITVQNNTSLKESFYALCSIKDLFGRYFDLPATEFNLEGGKKEKASFSWQVPAEAELEDLISGPYTVIVALWSEQPGSTGAERLATLEIEAAFYVLNHAEYFATFDETLWKKSNHSLGLGSLEPGNVTTTGESLSITLPAGSHDGGQIESRSADHLYGSYRARLKLPRAPSSITGFFLYKAPDFEHEIDIEIVNGPCGTIWFTTYAGGEVSNTYETNLRFDPTAGFHEYRFDFYPGEASFYVDGNLLQTFDSGLPDEPMYLMLNAWFPTWLDGEKPQEESTVLVDWIKY